MVSPYLDNVAIESASATTAHKTDEDAEAQNSSCQQQACQQPTQGLPRSILLPTLGLSAAFPDTLATYCRLVRRPADRLLVVDLVAGPQNRLVRHFPYSLYELSPGETQTRAELALQTAAEKTDRLRLLMERHGVIAYTYSLRLFHHLSETLAELFTENKPDALVLGREFELGKNFITDLAKQVPNGLVVLP